jgi:predicted small integral membrane protein
VSLLRSDRRLSLLYAAAAILGVAALASAIPGVEPRSGLRPGFTALSSALDPALDQTSDPPSSIFRWLAAIVRFVFFALLPPSLLYLVVSPNARRRVLIQVLSLLLVSYLVLRISPSLRAAVPAPHSPQGPGAAGQAAATVLEGGLPPRWLVAGVSSFIALGLLAAGYWVVRRARKVSDPRIGELRQALRALDRGQSDLESLIYQAYRTLCEVSGERRGIRRAQAMTPREYQAALELAALPSGPLARLTSLFEKASTVGRNWAKRTSRLPPLPSARF